MAACQSCKVPQDAPDRSTCTESRDLPGVNCGIHQLNFFLVMDDTQMISKIIFDHKEMNFYLSVNFSQAFFPRVCGSVVVKSIVFQIQSYYIPLERKFYPEHEFNWVKWLKIKWQCGSTQWGKLSQWGKITFKSLYIFSQIQFCTMIQFCTGRFFPSPKIHFFTILNFEEVQPQPYDPY